MIRSIPGKPLDLNLQVRARLKPVARQPVTFSTFPLRLGDDPRQISERRKRKNNNENNTNDHALLRPTKHNLLLFLLTLGGPQLSITERLEEEFQLFPAILAEFSRHPGPLEGIVKIRQPLDTVRRRSNPLLPHEIDIEIASLVPVHQPQIVPPIELRIVFAGSNYRALPLPCLVIGPVQAPVPPRVPWFPDPKDVRLVSRNRARARDRRKDQQKVIHAHLGPVLERNDSGMYNNSVSPRTCNSLISSPFVKFFGWKPRPIYHEWIRRLHFRFSHTLRWFYIYIYNCFLLTRTQRVDRGAV